MRRASGATTHACSSAGREPHQPHSASDSSSMITTGSPVHQSAHRGSARGQGGSGRSARCAARDAHRRRDAPAARPVGAAAEPPKATRSRRRRLGIQSRMHLLHLLHNARRSVWRTSGLTRCGCDSALHNDGRVARGMRVHRPPGHAPAAAGHIASPQTHGQPSSARTAASLAWHLLGSSILRRPCARRYERVDRVGAVRTSSLGR